MRSEAKLVKARLEVSIVGPVVRLIAL